MPLINENEDGGFEIVSDKPKPFSEMEKKKYENYETTQCALIKQLGPLKTTAIVIYGIPYLITLELPNKEPFDSKTHPCRQCREVLSIFAYTVNTDGRIFGEELLQVPENELPDCVKNYVKWLRKAVPVVRDLFHKNVLFHANNTYLKKISYEKLVQCCNDPGTLPRADRKQVRDNGCTLLEFSHYCVDSSNMMHLIKTDRMPWCSLIESGGYDIFIDKMFARWTPEISRMINVLLTSGKFNNPDIVKPGVDYLNAATEHFTNFDSRNIIEHRKLASFLVENGGIRRGQDGKIEVLMIMKTAKQVLDWVEQIQADIADGVIPVAAITKIINLANVRLDEGNYRMSAAHVIGVAKNAKTQFCFSLTWGNKSDLDIHVTLVVNGKKFTVCWECGKKQHPGHPQVYLDLDMTNPTDGRGIENISLPVDGTIVYDVIVEVHNFEERGSGETAFTVMLRDGDTTLKQVDGSVKHKEKKIVMKFDKLDYKAIHHPVENKLNKEQIAMLSQPKMKEDFEKLTHNGCVQKTIATIPELHHLNWSIVCHKDGNDFASAEGLDEIYASVNAMQLARKSDKGRSTAQVPIDLAAAAMDAIPKGGRSHTTVNEITMKTLFKFHAEKRQIKVVAADFQPSVFHKLTFPETASPYLEDKTTVYIPQMFRTRDKQLPLGGTPDDKRFVTLAQVGTEGDRYYGLNPGFEPVENIADLGNGNFFLKLSDRMFPKNATGEHMWSMVCVINDKIFKKEYKYLSAMAGILTALTKHTDPTTTSGLAIGAHVHVPADGSALKFNAFKAMINGKEFRVVG